MFLKLGSNVLWGRTAILICPFRLCIIILWYLPLPFLLRNKEFHLFCILQESLKKAHMGYKHLYIKIGKNNHYFMNVSIPYHCGFYCTILELFFIVHCNLYIYSLQKVILSIWFFVVVLTTRHGFDPHIFIPFHFDVCELTLISSKDQNWLSNNLKVVVLSNKSCLIDKVLPKLGEIIGFNCF